MSKTLLVYSVVALCMVSSSFEPIIARFCFTSLIITPFAMMTGKFLAGGIFSLPVLFKKRESLSLKMIQDVLPLAILLFTISSAQLFALKDLSATMVITILTTTPAFVAIVDSIRKKAVLSKTFWPGFFLCFIGIVMTLDLSELSSSGENPVKGLILTFMSVAMSTLYRTRLGTVSENNSSTTISSIMFLVCIFFSLACLPFAGEISSAGWLYASLTGLFAVLANISFVKAISLLGAARMSVISMIQRPFVIFLASFLLKEPLNYIQVLGILMVAGGIFLAKVKKS